MEHAEARRIQDHLTDNFNPPEGWMVSVALMLRDDGARDWCLCLLQECDIKEEDVLDKAVAIEPIEPFTPDRALEIAHSLVEHADTNTKIGQDIARVFVIIIDPASEGQVKIVYAANAIRVLWKPKAHAFDPLPYLADYGHMPVTNMGAGLYIDLVRDNGKAFIRSGIVLNSMSANSRLFTSPSVQGVPVERSGDLASDLVQAVAAAVLGTRGQLAALHSQTKALWFCLNQSSAITELIAINNTPAQPKK